MKKKEKMSGEITLEAAIVMPIILSLIITVICFVLYFRDGLVLESCVYGTASEDIGDNYDVFQQSVLESVGKEQLYVLEPKIQFHKGLESYKISIEGRLKVKIWGMNNLIDAVYRPTSITIEKNMSTKILYIARTIIKQAERK